MAKVAPESTVLQLATSENSSPTQVTFSVQCEEINNFDTKSSVQLTKHHISIYFKYILL